MTVIQATSSQSEGSDIETQKSLFNFRQRWWVLGQHSSYWTASSHSKNPQMFFCCCVGHITRDLFRATHTEEKRHCCLCSWVV